MDEWDDDIQKVAQAAAAAAAKSPGSSRASSPTSSSSSSQQQPPQQQQPAFDSSKSGGAAAPGTKVPWKDFFRSPPVWAVTVAHFCFNWGYYTLLAWLPSYFEMALGLNVQESSFLTLIPYVAMIIMTPVVSTCGTPAAVHMLLQCNHGVHLLQYICCCSTDGAVHMIKYTCLLELCAS
jgi:cyanate permease